MVHHTADKMKLLPVTLTLFDKATNNTYKGTLLLKNLDGLPDQNVTTTTEEPVDDYDGKGAGLFIILVVSVYALSIVLFIASFITKKATTAESSDDNMVNTYLHKVGDLKEKTARDHFKKLKMSIISKVEMDSENQKRGRKGSKGAKDMHSISRASSKTSLGEASKYLERSHRASTEAIPSTGLLPKEDDATQPLLSASQETPTPPTQELLSPNFDPKSGRCSPSLRRATSARMLSVIREVPDTESGENSPKVGRTRSYHDVSHNSKSLSIPNFPHSKSDSDATMVKKVISSEDIAVTAANKDKKPQQDQVEPEFGSRSSLFKPVKKKSDDQVNITVYDDDLEDDTDMTAQNQQPEENHYEKSQVNYSSMERPRPRYATRPTEHPEEIWQQRQQKPLPPPPADRTRKKHPNLHVHIPKRNVGKDVWVLRNGKTELREVRIPEERASSPEVDFRQSGSRRTRSPGHKNLNELGVPEGPRTMRELERSPSRRDRSQRDKSPRAKSPRDRSPRDKSPRDKSPRDRSPKERLPGDRTQKDWSPRDWSRDRSPRGLRDPDAAFLYPHDARSLPLPFRSPSPRSPPRSPIEHMPPQTRISPSPFRSSPEAAGAAVGVYGNWRDKATLKVTLDRSPEPLEEEDPYACANKAYEQSPRLTAVRESRTERGRTPPRVSFGEGSGSRLQVPQPRFPVTFNSPGLPRRTADKDNLQISNV